MADVAVEIKPWVPEDSFGSRLVLVRRELDLTTEEAAKRCGLKAPTWNTWENGARPRGMNDVVEAIHKGLGVSRAWLMWGFDSPKTRSDKRERALTLASSRPNPVKSKDQGSPILVTV